MSILSATGFIPLKTSGRTGVFTRILKRLSLQKQRHELARLSPHALRDIGMTKAQADAEASRPIWDAPTHFYK